MTFWGGDPNQGDGGGGLHSGYSLYFSASYNFYYSAMLGWLYNCDLGTIPSHVLSVCLSLGSHNLWCLSQDRSSPQPLQFCSLDGYSDSHSARLTHVLRLMKWVKWRGWNYAGEEWGRLRECVILSAQKGKLKREKRRIELWLLIEP